MTVARLLIQNFRNLQSTTIDLDENLNFFIGDNGSGKSSLLEALFFIAHGKSFRTTKLDNLACYQTNDFVVSVKSFDGGQFGLSRDIQAGQTTIKINGERHLRLSDLAKNIAVQIITPESFKLFFGGPKERRRFVDLGMFHVKHEFSSLWKRFSRVLKQRNACIKSNADSTHTLFWTNEFCILSEAVAAERKVYVAELIKELQIWIELLLPDISNSVSVQYSQGWSQKRDLSEVLASNMEREANYGYSLYGAHKFDVVFLLHKKAIETQLSRGQQKLFLLALTFAQSKLIARVKQVKPILLIDDIGAELDSHSRTLLAVAIENLSCQVVITAIEPSVLNAFVSHNKAIKYKMFHVKHGEILIKDLYQDASDA